MAGVSNCSPSDLSGELAGQRLRVAGRVSLAHGRVCELADALASMHVHFRSEPALAAGDLLVVEGRYDGRGLCEAELVERAAQSEPRGDGDWARFAGQGVARNLRARHCALGGVRRYFAQQGFIEVETPFRVPAPGVDMHLDAIPALGGHLITSPELHMKRLLAAGMPRIFQLARASRKDELGRFHEPEFSMLEWYRSFAGLAEVMLDTEHLLRAVAETVSGTSQLFGPDGGAIDIAAPFQRVTVREAFREYAGVADAVDLSLTDEDRYFEHFVAHVEPGLAREVRPIFLWQYPANQAALARLSDSDASVAERFELYVAGVELCNGFDELTDASEQRLRFELDRQRRLAEGRPVYPLDERFLAALDGGMPRAGGNALGFDRVLMLALGARDLSECMAFPARMV